ncbi:cell division protein MraZ [Xylella fastidiosa subsp. multiplex Griffin-1]|uniref:Transcriptional regulator MraZ n=1 Tax=Xylella fastidiosa subsp. sandyi Ann-1 TaxID=155920 RepID=A0A060H5G4_XYLFS|nr:division/cell wall cluster transcriptional repressor MraZ [Xylella fastidiosa]ACA12922.1 MraZ protein [Xylella fastidiosa M12]AIC10813.1 cell division protein MraZ [Xylella fastidiosa subsp. sandyi Ann-1]ERI60090.1 cell division protein MraZ [Xylella fastidiosa subsp. multiplex Griffin-1]
MVFCGSITLRCGLLRVLKVITTVFQGETAITLDDKGRMVVPAVYRDLIARMSANRLVLTYNPFEAGCLWLYVEKEWERVRDELMVKPNAHRVVRVLQQKLVGSSALLELDANGRISVPSSHRSAVAIEKKAVLLGMGDKFELWSEQAHHALIQQTLSDGDLGDGLLDLRL